MNALLLTLRDKLLKHTLGVPLKLDVSGVGFPDRGLENPLELSTPDELNADDDKTGVS